MSTLYSKHCLTLDWTTDRDQLRKVLACYEMTLESILRAEEAWQVLFFQVNHINKFVL